MPPLSNLKVGDLIEAQPVQTVIRIEEGRTRSESISSNFVFTAEVARHFSVLARALEAPTGQGYFLQGDFGSGKSHFLAALTAWLARRPGAEALAQGHEGLRSAGESARRHLVADISLVNYRSSTPLEAIVTDAVAESLRRDKHAQAAEALGPSSTGRERLAHIKTMIEAVTGAGYAGLVLLIDELSEFFRSKPDPAALNEDARTLQLLGELSRERPLWIIAAVQESIEQTGDIAQATFRKIKDRFPVKLPLSTLHIRDLISRRLVRRREGAEELLMAVFQSLRENFPGFIGDFDAFQAIYPFHPATLSLLEGLGDLFSQHRGIVDFVHARLAGDPQRGIASHLNRPCTELVAPDALYEHFAGRLAEFSAFHQYPRHIVPHLDEVIAESLNGQDDQALARRLVRMLVLYAIHPTAGSPRASTLAQLACCTIAPHDPRANVEFIARALLDPVVARSRFLVRRDAASGDCGDATYAVSTKEEHGKTFTARLERIMADLHAGDSRLVTAPLSELPASLSWPGPELMKGEIIRRQVTWRQSVRTALVAFAHGGMEQQCAARLAEGLAAGDADFAVALVVGDTQIEAAHTAVWRIPGPGAQSGPLREYCAVRMLMAELKPANPADAPLVPMAKDHAKRLEAAVNQALFGLIYGGRFDGGPGLVDSAAMQLKRFDRLLEMAAESICEERFPHFAEIAPRSVPPGMRIYQRILDDLVVPGSLGLHDARARGLTESIETLAAPLGLVELKTGAYRLSPNPAQHPFLSHVFSLLGASGPTPVKQIIRQMRQGPYGVPAETAAFVLVALAHCGMMTLLEGGRAKPLEFINLMSFDRVDAVAPGDLIGQADRDTLTRDCPFLAPQGGWGSFGLRQQREAWQNLNKAKKSMETLLGETASRLAAAAQFDAFQGFDMAGIESRLTRLRSVFDEVKVSYAAREGLERFCGAWRSSGLTAQDLEAARRLHRFLERQAENFVAIALFLRHRSVENAAAADAALSQHRAAVQAMLAEPETLVLRDEGVQLAAAFELFRESYARLYTEAHGAYYRSCIKKEPSRQAQRLVGVMRRLAAIEPLDRPPGLDMLLGELDAPARQACKRNLREELLRSAVCGCGFQFGDAAEPVAEEPLDRRIEQCFSGYQRILAAPPVLEAMTARAFALRDDQPEVARRLDELRTIAADAPAQSGALLLDYLDERTIAELGRALAGAVTVHSRSLRALGAELSGRRLTPAKIRDSLGRWLGETPSDAIIAIEGFEAGARQGATDASWWPLLRPDLFSAKQVLISAEDARRLERSCEDLFPAENLRQRFVRLDTARLVEFIAQEPCHTRALHEAWVIVAERVLHGSAHLDTMQPSSRHLVPAEADGVIRRLGDLKAIDELLRMPVPARLRCRIRLAGMLEDAWSSQRLVPAVEAAIEELARSAGDWLAGLAPVAPIDMSDNPVVLLVDGVAPDVWLEAAETMTAALALARQSWERLTGPALTVPGMNARFGFAPQRDPLDEFAARGVAYHMLQGDEPHGLDKLLPQLPDRSPAVIRLGALDAAVHEGRARLPELPGMLRNMLARHLPELIDLARAARRRLLLTTDHGCTLARRRLSHGKGGVFEEALITVQWAAAAGA